MLATPPITPTDDIARAKGNVIVVEAAARSRAVAPAMRQALERMGRRETASTARRSVHGDSVSASMSRSVETATPTRPASSASARPGSSKIVRAGAPSALARLTEREREVLELMAEGLSNSQIEQRLYLSTAAVGKHVANIFTKLGLPPGEQNRRVRAVLAWLRATES